MLIENKTIRKFGFNQTKNLSRQWPAAGVSVFYPVPAGMTGFYKRYYAKKGKNGAARFAPKLIYLGGMVYGRQVKKQ
jgi:hypothetical protein